VTTIERLLTKFPAPWRVYTGKLRPQFPTPIVEIIAADGATVFPWSSFDPTGLSHRERIALAKLLVESVNVAAERGGEK
jgi:hypothetical protein